MIESADMIRYVSGKCILFDIILPCSVVWLGTAHHSILFATHTACCTAVARCFGLTEYQTPKQATGEAGAGLHSMHLRDSSH